MRDNFKYGFRLVWITFFIVCAYMIFAICEQVKYNNHCVKSVKKGKNIQCFNLCDRIYEGDVEKCNVYRVLD